MLLAHAADGARFPPKMLAIAPPDKLPLKLAPFSTPAEVRIAGGVAPSIRKDKLFDCPPMGAGLLTATCAVPATGRSDAVIAACNCVSLLNVVARGLPFQSTADVWANPSPLTVSVNPALPGAALTGDSHFDAGNGLPTESLADIEMRS